MGARDYLEKLKQVLDDSRITCRKGANAVPVDCDWEEGFAAICEMFASARVNGKNVCIIGNGGSAGIAEHFLADFLKNGGLKTVNLLGPALVTCMANDFGYEEVYAKSLYIAAAKGDILVAVSSSGDSANIVKAVNVANSLGLNTLTLSGFKEDNKIRGMGQYNIWVPLSHYGIVESIHSLLLQQIVDTIMEIN